LGLESTREQIRLRIHGIQVEPRIAECSAVALKRLWRPQGKAASSKSKTFETLMAMQFHSTQELKEMIVKDSIKNSILLQVNTSISRSPQPSNMTS